MAFKIKTFFSNFSWLECLVIFLVLQNFYVIFLVLDQQYRFNLLLEKQIDLMVDIKKSLISQSSQVEVLSEIVATTSAFSYLVPILLVIVAAALFFLRPSTVSSGETPPEAETGFEFLIEDLRRSYETLYNGQTATHRQLNDLLHLTMENQAKLYKLNSTYYLCREAEVKKYF